MSDFRFADPNWSHALWLVAAAVALALWLEFRRGDVLSRFLSPAMQTRLVHRPSRARRWLSIVGLGLAGASLVAALMRPQWGLMYQEAPRVGAQIMVCLDVSKSMLAEDTAPNRLERAKAELTDLLSYLGGDQVGLIAFAGRATVLCPLTPDFGFFKLILDGAGPHSVGRGGTRLEEPIRKALDGFRSESDVSRVLVLITDGEDHDSHALDAAKAAAERGVKILAIGFGDEAGSEIFVTDPQTGARTQVRDGDGRPVITRLDGDTLREMALATDGAYIPAGTGALDLKSIYDAHIAPLVRGQLDDRGHAVRRDAFQWAVLAGFVLLVASIVVGSGSVKAELRTWGAWHEARPVSRSVSARQTSDHVSSSAGAVGTARRVTALLVLAATVAFRPAHAQEAQSDNEAPTITADGVEQASPHEKPKSEQPGPSKPAAPRSVEPREVYNEALAYLDTDFDRAERMLSEARREAATDGDVRFRSTYNLGWVEVKRADKLVGEQPQDALVHLRRAADWFRDAVRLRPDDTDARFNLEVVLRRIVVLADSLARHDERNLAQRLDELIEAQRRVVSAGRQMVDRVAAEADPNAADRFRGEFRQRATEQRKVLSDSQSLSQAAREELEALGGKKDEEKSPQDKVRAAQLSSLLHYANRAEQRLGQARGQMRRREAGRSFRRAAAGLAELKRARDQLRGPVEVLDVLLADAASLVQLTSVKAEETRLLGKATLTPRADDDVERTADASRAGDSPDSVPSLPWLTREYLEEEQSSLSERTSELTARFQTAVEQPSPAAPSANQQSSPSTAEAQESPQAERFLAMVREALPFLEKGQGAFQSASQALSTDRLDEAAGSQVEAIAALRDARERFLDLRGLVELAYARQTEIQRLLPAAEESGAGGTSVEQKNGSEQDQDSSPSDARPASESDAADETALRMKLAAQLQSENVERGERLARLIDDESSALPPAPADGVTTPTPAQPADSAAQQASAERQRLQLARELLERARDEMSQVRDLAVQATAAKTTDDDSKPPAERGDSAESTPALDGPKDVVNEARIHADRAVEHLQALRRLFFSIAEHLRETAQRQAELNDETEQAAGFTDRNEAAGKAEPLAHRQRELQSIARQIAEALHEQATQPPPDERQPAKDANEREQLAALAEQYTKAGKLVDEGQEEMSQAADGIQDAGFGIQGGKSEEEAVGKDVAQPTTPKPDSRIPHPALGEARKHQDAALEKLLEALALFEPPRPEQQQNQQGQNQNNQNSQTEDEQKNKPEGQAAGVDQSRLLQAVRDREAQRRRRERERRGRFGQEPVEKDW